jgi:drug/metabolite transporter (DMT)-like permease
VNRAQLDELRIFEMWLFLALVSYFLFAAVTIADKYLLAKPIPDARVYTFYMGILGIFVLALAPFGIETSNIPLIFLGMFGGVIYTAALFLFFSALRAGEVSRIGISIGGLIPIFALLFIYIWTRELPSVVQLGAFFVLMLGSFVIIFERFVKLIHNLKRFGFILIASVLFGLYFALAKFLLQEQSFISVIVWTRIGAVFVSFFFLFSPSVRKIIFAHKKSPPKKAGAIFLLKNAAGGAAAFLQHAAIATARTSEVSLVSALQGVQFALVFFGVVFLTKKHPRIVREEVHGEALAVKLLGTGLIIVGIVILAVA